MPVISSTITDDARQVDGRRRIEELPTDQKGVKSRVSYLSATVFDALAAMAANRILIDARMKLEELEGMLTVYPWDYIQTETTGAELTTYYRESYKNGSNGGLSPVASRVIEWIDKGRFTDTQVRTAFGLSVAQWTILKNKMAALVSANITILSAVGE